MGYRCRQGDSGSPDLEDQITSEVSHQSDGIARDETQIAQATPKIVSACDPNDGDGLTRADQAKRCFAVIPSLGMILIRSICGDLAVL